MDRHYRRLARKFYRMLRHPRRRKASSAHRWLGTKVFDRRLWVPERHAFMNGMAVGMFFAMLPPFTPQMGLTAIVNIWRKWNIPVGLAACWISNFFTWIPQLYIQMKLGMWSLSWFVKDAGKAGLAFEQLEGIYEVWKKAGGKAAFDAFQPQASAIISPLALPYGIGIVLSGIILAIASYIFGHIFWTAFAHRVPVRHTVPHRQPPTE